RARLNRMRPGSHTCHAGDRTSDAHTTPHFHPERHPQSGIQRYTNPAAKRHAGPYSNSHTYCASARRAGSI
ncbi:MAG TPA: hypothetical protein VLG46_03685, partial [Anaerolineae bacterium]|nr:hypothetical protein [Anaerolineae bacterium]